VPIVAETASHPPGQGPGRDQSSSRYVVAEVDEIPPGGRKIVDLDGISVGVFYVNGEYFALLNWCPHQAARLCEGQLWSALESSVPGEYRTSRPGEVVACIWHGWEFDLRTGQSWCDPERLRVRAYDVAVEPGTAVAGDRGAGAPAAGGAEGADGADGAATTGRRKGPYVATTYPVSTEGRYVVVDLSRTASHLPPTPPPPRGPTAEAIRGQLP
jgi:3-phenylpropionate/trans-cinnamate dioxygenase ferredoxin subunit